MKLGMNLVSVEIQVVSTQFRYCTPKQDVHPLYFCRNQSLESLREQHSRKVQTSQNWVFSCIETLYGKRPIKNVYYVKDFFPEVFKKASLEKCGSGYVQTTPNGSKVLHSTFNYEIQQVFLTTSLLDFKAFLRVR